MSLDLDAIKARYAQYGPKVQAGTAVADIRALLAEVERLRAELACDVCTESRPSLAYEAHKAAAPQTPAPDGGEKP